MKLKDIINEWSQTPKSVIEYLQNKGYKLLGKGVDQSAFEEPKTGKVLKIFGAKKAKSSKANPGHIMFEVWHEYCEKNKYNPFLPKFSGWTYFDFQDQTFMQIRMERLIPIDSGVSNALEFLSDSFYNYPIDKFDDVKDHILSQIGKEHFTSHKYFSADDLDMPSFFGIPSHDLDELNQLMILLGKKKFLLLLDTLKEVGEISKKKGYHFDLHEGNFMHRHDGVPVIVDPWVVDSYRSVGKMSRGLK